MKLSKYLKPILLEELRFALNQMRNTDIASMKLYAFSIVFGATNRTMNIEFDPELAFIHDVTQNTHRAITSSVALAGQNQPTIPSSLVFASLEEALNEMINLIDEDKQTHSALEKISNIAYSTTGNGYYLYLRGKLKL